MSRGSRQGEEALKILHRQYTQSAFIVIFSQRSRHCLKVCQQHGHSMVFLPRQFVVDTLTQGRKQWSDQATTSDRRRALACLMSGPINGYFTWTGRRISVKPFWSLLCLGSDVIRVRLLYISSTQTTSRASKVFDSRAQVFDSLNIS